MADQVVSTRYAEALIGAVAEPGELDTVHEEMLALDEVMRENENLRVFLEGPNVPQHEKHELVDKVFGERLSPLALDFVHMLLHKHRIDQLDGIVEEFTHLVEERRNQIRVKITTAIELGPDVMERLKRAVDARLGKDCILEPRVDPRVIGGVVAVVGDRVVDGSLRTALDDLAKDLTAAPLSAQSA